jgi:hypothetical protein
LYEAVLPESSKAGLGRSKQAFRKMEQVHDHQILKLRRLRKRGICKSDDGAYVELLKVCIAMDRVVLEE